MILTYCLFCLIYLLTSFCILGDSIQKEFFRYILTEKDIMYPYHNYEWYVYHSDLSCSVPDCTIIAVCFFSSSVGTHFIIECMWFHLNFMHARQQSKLSGVFTAKIIQYLFVLLILVELIVGHQSMLKCSFPKILKYYLF